MNIKEEEIMKLRAMLDRYAAQNGATSAESVYTQNCTLCLNSCTNGCTQSCYHYCDGNSGVCWNFRFR